MTSRNKIATHDQTKHQSLWRGCVGAWAPCLGPTGLTLRDWSGRANHGTLTNMDAAGDWAVSGGRYALDFDGVDDHVVCPTISIARSLSISAWINLRSTSAAVIIEKRPTNGQWILLIQGSELILRGGSAAQISVAFTTANKWVHICGTIFDTTAALSVDGNQVQTGTVAAILNGTQAITIGKYMDFGGGNFVDGQIDDLRLYSRILSAQEIRLLASRRGIAFEMAPRRRSSVASAFNRRRRLLIGAGS